MTDQSASPDGPIDPWKLRMGNGLIAPGWVVAPLRLFLGVTFIYAGLQKLANPDFFRSSSPISIHAQLAGATRSSPIHAVLGALVHVATLVGLVIAFGELAIGMGVVVGLWTRVAAAAGMALSFGLFLTVSFHSSPYFTGADIVFIFAWTPLLLGGAAGAPAADTWLSERRRATSARRPRPGPLVTRRQMVTNGGLVAGAVVLIGGIAAAVGRVAYQGGTGSSSPSATIVTPPSTTGRSTTPASTPAAPTSTTTRPPAAPAGREIGPASDVPD